MAANLQSVRTLCHGCLSADRELSPIGEFSDMFNMICAKRTRVPGLKYTSLCWECTATLKRMLRFHKQVKNAQTLLKSCIHFKDASWSDSNSTSIEITRRVFCPASLDDLVNFWLQKSLPKTLSRLKATGTNHNFISLIELDELETGIKLLPLDEIKEEEGHDEDKELIYKFESDLDMKETKSDKPEHDKEDFYQEDDAFDEENYIKPEEVTDLEQEEKNQIRYESEDDTDISEASIEENRKELLEDPTFIVQLKDLKEKQPMEKRYCHINTAEEMCVEEQARLSDLVKLWGSEQGSQVQETVFRCLVCGHRSPSLEAARPHVAIHKNVVKCLLCEFCCQSPRVARSHHRIAHIDFLCDYCGKKCLSKLLIQQHISRYHLENKCEQCSRAFTNYKKLKDHMSIVHDKFDQSEETFCVKCNKQFKNKRRLMRHLQGAPAHAQDNGKAKKRVKCLACDKMYPKRSAMMDHYRFVHLGIPKYYCSDCDKGCFYS